MNTQKTEASSTTFEIGTSKKDRRGWCEWHSNDSTTFDVPGDFLNVATLYIHATSNPNDKNSWFCVYYQANGIKHFDFDDDEDHEMGQGDRDGECR